MYLQEINVSLHLYPSCSFAFSVFRGIVKYVIVVRTSNNNIHHETSVYTSNKTLTIMLPNVGGWISGGKIDSSEVTPPINMTNSNAYYDHYYAAPCKRVQDDKLSFKCPLEKS